MQVAMDDTWYFIQNIISMETQCKKGKGVCYAGLVWMLNLWGLLEDVGDAQSKSKFCNLQQNYTCTFFEFSNLSSLTFNLKVKYV